MSALLDRIANDERICLNRSDKIPYDWNDFISIFNEEKQIGGGYCISALLATKLMMPKIMSRKFVPRGKNPADEVEDYIEECYLAILEKMPDYDPAVSKFPAYIQYTLVGVAGNHVRDGHATYRFTHFVTKYNSVSLDAPTRAAGEDEGTMTLSECVPGSSMEEALSERVQLRKDEVIRTLNLEKEERTLQDNFEFSALAKLLGGYEEWNDYEQEQFIDKLRERRMEHSRS